MNQEDKAALIAEYNNRQFEMNQKKIQEQLDTDEYLANKEIRRKAKEEYDPDMNQRILRRMAIVLSHRDPSHYIPTGMYMSFREISTVLELTEYQAKTLYLNAVRKIKIIMERRGINLDIENTRDDLKGMF